LDILFDCSIDNFLNGSVMSQVDNFNSCILQNATHDIYGGIMTIKKRCCRDYPDVVRRFVNFNFRAH